MMGGDAILRDIPMPRKKNPPLSCISIGPYIRLYSEDHFLKELAPLGFSRNTLRRFLKSLSVPTLHLSGTRYIDALTLSIALRAILQIGRPDYLAPGCDALATGEVPKDHIRALDPDDVRENLETLIFQLLAAHKTQSWEIAPTQIADAARDAARRLIHAGFISLPHSTQTEYTRQAIHAVRTDPIDPRLANPPAPSMGGDA